MTAVPHRLLDARRIAGSRSESLAEEGAFAAPFHAAESVKMESKPLLSSKTFRYAATIVGVVGTVIWMLLLLIAAYAVALVLWVVGLRGPLLFHRLIVLRLGLSLPSRSLAHLSGASRFCGS